MCGDVFVVILSTSDRYTEIHDFGRYEGWVHGGLKNDPLGLWWWWWWWLWFYFRKCFSFSVQYFLHCKISARLVWLRFARLVCICVEGWNVWPCVSIARDMVAFWQRQLSLCLYCEYSWSSVVNRVNPAPPPRNPRTCTSVSLYPLPTPYIQWCL